MYATVSPLAYLQLILAHSKCQGQGHARFDLMSRKRWQIEQTLPLPTNRKLHDAFPLDIFTFDLRPF